MKLWTVVAVVAIGFLTFGVGIWYFDWAGGLPFASNAAAPLELPDLSQAAAAPAPVPSPPEEIDSAPPEIDETLRPAPPVNPRLTLASYERIHDGMTEDEVTAFLGDPTAVRLKSDLSRKPPRQIRVLRWRQLKPFEEIEVEFVDGLSRATFTTLSAAEPPKKPSETSQPSAPPVQPASPPAQSPKPRSSPSAWPGLTRANFDQIQNGMTESQVVSLLGLPSGSATRTGTMNSNLFYIKTLTWRQQASSDVSLTVLVTLRNDKVSGKNWIQVGPKKR